MPFHFVTKIECDLLTLRGLRRRLCAALVIVFCFSFSGYAEQMDRNHPVEVIERAKDGGGVKQRRMVDYTADPKIGAKHVFVKQPIGLDMDFAKKGDIFCCPTKVEKSPSSGRLLDDQDWLDGTVATIAVAVDLSPLDLVGAGLREQLGIVDRFRAYRFSDLCSRMKYADGHDPDIGYVLVGRVHGDQYIVDKVMRPPTLLSQVEGLCRAEERIPPGVSCIGKTDIGCMRAVERYIATSKLLPRKLGLTAKHDLLVSTIDNDWLF